ncbi:MAG: recombinase RecT [Acidobacteria bacterium]|nr:recombinase RecT [Acidobacteriota bacterium]
MPDTQQQSDDMSPAVIERPGTLPQAVKAGDRVPMTSFGGSFMVAPQSLGELVEMAKLMAGAGPMVGKAVRGNTGACLGIILQAGRVNMDPFALSLKAYMVNDAIAYEAQAVAAMIYASPVLDGRLDYEFSGSGDELTCTVRGRIKGESKERVYTSPAKGTIKTQNSPLWKADPEQQLGYYSARAWARRHVPDVIMGVYTREEAEAMPGGFVNVTPEKADPAERLLQNLAEGRKASAPDQPEPDPPAASQPIPENEPDADDDQAQPLAAETEGEAGEKPAAGAEPSVQELPPHPGELIRTKKGGLEYAERWAVRYRALPADQEDAFIDETAEDCRLAKALNPKAEDIMSDAVNSPKTPV